VQRVVSQIELADFHGGTLVPTMGALHAGHLSLIRRAALLTRPVVVSVFVNPTQFAAGEDLGAYPRRLDADCEAAAAAGADVLFAPPASVVYPAGEVVDAPPLPPVATRPGLEDARRPTHFAGVCQVVARLFDLVRPRFAVFGEKDYQQLLVVEAMVRGAAAGGRWPDLEIVRTETVREADGLALSSRNEGLAPSERLRAVALSRALAAAAAIDAAAGPTAAERALRLTLEAADLDVDYAVVRDAVTLAPLSDFARPARALVAARLGSVRLIDNSAVPQSGAAVPRTG